MGRTSFDEDKTLGDGLDEMSVARGSFGSFGDMCEAGLMFGVIVEGKGRYVSLFPFCTPPKCPRNMRGER